MGKKKIGKYTFPGGTQAEQISDAFRQLSLEASANSFQFLAEKMIDEHGTPYDFLQQLLEHEYVAREEARINRWLQQSKMPEIKRVKDFPFSRQPSVDPVLIRELASCRYIEKGKNVLFLGGAGVGKTSLALALGSEAILNGIETRYMTHNEFDGAVNRVADSSITRLYSLCVLS